MVSTPGGAALPESVGDSVPFELTTVIELVNCPTAVGAKVALTVIDAPGASVEFTAGSPVALKGATGGVTCMIVSGVPPSLENVTEPVRVPPTAVPPKLSNLGDELSTPRGETPGPFRATPS